ncbi:MAG: BolA family protein [Hyphomonadaceae bacterium]|nr:BolA family protein [Hyphomonadaceae bacterium]
MGANKYADKELTELKSELSRASRITKTLQAHFTPDKLEVIDESHFHAGHAGARPEGETHFRVRVTSAAFAGKSRVDRQRLINAALGEEFENGLHALAMELKAPGEG